MIACPTYRNLPPWMGLKTYKIVPPRKLAIISPSLTGAFDLHGLLSSVRQMVYSSRLEYKSRCLVKGSSEESNESKRRFTLPRLSILGVFKLSLMTFQRPCIALVAPYSSK